MTLPSTDHNRPSASEPHPPSASGPSSSHLPRLQPNTYGLPANYPPRPSPLPCINPYLPLDPRPLAGNMATATVLPPNDILTPQLPGHSVRGMYPSGSGRSPSGNYPPAYDPRLSPQARPDTERSRPRDNVRYDPYPHDGRRKTSGQVRDERIVLPPPSMAGLRLPDDPNAPKHVLPSINPPSWEGRGRVSPLPPVQLPSLRSISGDTPASVRPIQSPTPRSHDRPMQSPRMDPYQVALSPAMSRPSYPPPGSYPQRPYDVAPYPYPQDFRHQPLPPPLPPSRKTHPPPHDSRNSPPLRVKHEPELSPPLRQTPSGRGEHPFYPRSPSRYSPPDATGYTDTRRGSIASVNNGDEKGVQVVGQTRRLAHLMSEQKRREYVVSIAVWLDR
jgi:hypothetical protein